MSSSSIGPWITIESGVVPDPNRSRSSFQHDLYSGPGRTFDIEMHPMPHQTPTPSIGAKTEPSQESKRSSFEENADIQVSNEFSEQMQTVWNPYKNRYRVSAACLISFAMGMSDSAAGALIASIERDYNIGYGTVSIIFVCQALGFIAAAFFIGALSVRIGRAKCMMISGALLVIGYAIIVITPPFPLVAVSFFVLGIGMAINLAICQVFCANLANNTAVVGTFQGIYGIGGICGPLIATALLSKGITWSRFYAILLTFAALNFAVAPWSFWKYESESDLVGLTPATTANEQDLENVPSEHGHEHQGTAQQKWRSFKTLLSDKTTVLGALFIFAYQGSEVAISGWVISFLVQFRHGDPSKVGFVTAGFWGGITLGRFTLSFLAHRIGERLFVFIVTVGALILELLIWFIPSIPGDSVAVAFSGLLLGPIYPCAVHIFQRLIPKKKQISSLSFIGSVGSSGGAVAPFMTGMIAQHVGTFVLHPICIGLFVCMGLSWWLLPKTEKRSE